jgi:UDP-hydrolysing UDP-N-acetyl-D-glucosamine 2-epimerase
VRKVCIVVTARPSWAKLEPVCRALKARGDVELQIVACASALLERYGNVSAVIEAQGYAITERVWSVYEGSTLQTSVMETGALCTALASTFTRLRPDVVLVMADRHEVLAAAQAARYLHLDLAHCQGGEKSGSVDDRCRDAITALADIHFPCTELAAFRVYCMTGSHAVYNYGCPSVDVAKQAQAEPPVTMDELGGDGDRFDLEEPFVLVLQHPVTDEADEAHAQMATTLSALPGLTRKLVMWPGQDAGSDGAAKAIREFRAGPQNWLHTVRNLPPNRFLRLLTQASVLVGNSSAGIRESAYLGVPVVDIGSRQAGRQRARNVVWVPHDAAQIASAIQRQIAHGKYVSSDLYGTGNAGEQIAEVLADGSHRTDTGEAAVYRLSR